MLADSDHDLVRREEKNLPGLRVVLDPAAMLERLRCANPELDVTSIRSAYVRYKPGTNCLVAFEVGVGDRQTRVHAKAWNRACLAALGKHAVPGPGDRWGLRGVFLQDEATVIRVFPDDARLKSLPAWADPGRRAELAVHKPALECLPATSTSTVLAYKPERRLVARLETNPGTPAVVVKVHAPAGFEAARVAARAIREGSRFRVPRLLGRSRSNLGMLFEWVEGTVLQDRLLGAAPDLELVAQTGAALAEFHRQPAEPLGFTTPARLAGSMPDHARALAQLLPHLAERVHAVGERAACVIASAPSDRALLHGDLHPRQVLAGGDRITFLDLDSALMGPAWVDLARFAAQLEIDVLAGRLNRSGADGACRALLEGYRMVSAGTPAEAPGGLVAAALLQQSVQFFRLRDAGWPHLMEAAVERCEELLSGVRSRCRSVLAPEAHSPASRGAPDLDPAMPFLSKALDARWMDERLRALESPRPELEGHRLESAGLLRHKPGRRCLIEYRFARTAGGGGFSWLGKARARSNRRGSVARALRNAGLDASSCVSVPEPIGEIPELNLELQQCVAGHGVFALLHPPDGPAIAGRCAAGVSRLHSSGVVVARMHSMADELAILDTRLAQACATAPELARRIEAVRRGCRLLAATLSPVEPTLVHRDFYPDQVLVDGERLWILDLDLCAMGDPCIDHGNFLAHIVEWSLRTLGRSDALRACEEAYREAAVSRLGRHAARRIEAWTTLSLARHIQLTQHFPERRPFTAAVLKLCEERLADAGIHGRFATPASI